MLFFQRERLMWAVDPTLVDSISAPDLPKWHVLTISVYLIEMVPSFNRVIDMSFGRFGGFLGETRKVINGLRPSKA